MTVYSKDRESVFLLITKWLDGYRKSDGGWAKITREDINNLYIIIMGLVEHKCQADPDGDRPIDVHLIDRTLYWPNRFCDVPYDDDDDDESPNSEVMQALLDNVKRANSQLSDFLKTW